MRQKHRLPKFEIPGYVASSRDTLEDGNLVAKAVVERTGFRGRGNPIYIAPYTEGASLTKNQEVMIIHNGQTIYITPEHTPDKW